MAPWPEQGNEPKAPDKSRDNLVDSNQLRVQKEGLTVGASTVDSMIIKSTEQVVVAEKESRVSALDEYGLKALLDEAMSYKIPKDVEGKSTLFKELLHSVESNKKYPESMVSLRGRPVKNTTKKSRRRQQSRREVGGVLDKTNDQTSLQDLVQAISIAESGNNYKGRGKSRTKTETNSINTTQKEAGFRCSMNDETSSEDYCISKSTPSGLKQSQIIKQESNECRCECTGDVPVEIPLPPQSPTKQTSTETNGVEQSSISSVKTIVGMTENKIPKSGIEEERDGSHSSSNDEEEIDTSKAAAAGEQSTIGNRILDKGLFNLNKWDPSAVGITVLDYRDSNASSRFTKEGITDKKALDENGNTLGSNRFENGIDPKRKQRRLKVKNDKNTIMSENIKGHRSDLALSDIEAVVKYIESPTGIDYAKISSSTRQNGSFGFAKQGRVNKMRTVRDKSSETVGRKGRRGKDGKLHKSNSLEEISTSKLEDLTNDDADSADKFSPKQTTVDDFELDTDRTWELSNPYMHLANDSGVDKTLTQLKREIKCDSDIPADSEFHIVTKKQRKKKRSSTSRVNSSAIKVTTSSCYYRSERSFHHSHDGGRRDSLYRYSRSQCDPQRRKSASSVPPSDKSADSSDLDSVHSLPVSSTTKKALPVKKSTSSGSTPQASYADIARSVASPPRGNSNNALNRSMNSNFMEGCVEGNQSRPFSPEQVPTVVFSLPPKDYKADVYKENMDKEYPPLDQPNERKPKINDMFVEFTVYMPKTVTPTPCVNVSVEETVLVKSSNTKSNVSASESLSFVLEGSDNTPCKRPPVILMNESSVDASAVELVFGFEVNQQLLGNQNEKKEDDATNPTSEVPVAVEAAKNSLRDHGKVQGNVCYLVGDPHEHNHDNIVDFISGEWEAVMNELAEDGGSGKIRYFNSL